MPRASRAHQVAVAAAHATARVVVQAAATLPAQGEVGEELRAPGARATPRPGKRPLVADAPLPGERRGFRREELLTEPLFGGDGRPEGSRMVVGGADEVCIFGG